ncbi:hypothetical protein QBC43DRAFT_289961 [Cladorrhinum sp. PSN259]|nr:hypothetical protein QBC43DRAFT_289961 [Cladorrhinum sp. PSN259]
MAYEGNVTDLLLSNTTNLSGKALAEGAYTNNVVDLTPDNTTNSRCNDDCVASIIHQVTKADKDTGAQSNTKDWENKDVKNRKGTRQPGCVSQN